MTQITNKSTILPATIHVQILWERYSAAKIDWCKAHCLGRVDVFAYVSDDPLDHHHILAVVDGTLVMNQVSGSMAELEIWGEGYWQDTNMWPTMLFAFETKSEALLFKLTHGGV